MILVSVFPNLVVIVVDILLFSVNAVANSLRVSNAAGAPSTKFDISVLTNSVVAICVSFVPLVAVGAVGTPVSVADSSGAYIF